jgi:hypothetical protein
MAIMFFDEQIMDKNRIEEFKVLVFFQVSKYLININLLLYHKPLKIQ